ncbi:hypothetical protein HDU92_003922, partial [Lobulomyces angularis]
TSHTELITQRHKLSFDLFWAHHEDEIEFGFAAKGRQGWIAFGPSLIGEMKGSDIIWGYTDPLDKKFKVQDRFMKLDAIISIDKVQNLEVISGEQNENGTAFTFKRKYMLCNEEDLPILSTQRFIFAAGFSNERNLHEDRGTMEVQLGGKFNSPCINENIKNVANTEEKKSSAQKSVFINLINVLGIFLFILAFQI